jgi:antitoxin StbD
MEHLLTHKTVSLTELRDPAKVLEKAGSTPVAVLNRNKVVGYFVPNSAVESLAFEAATEDEVLDALRQSRDEMQPVLDYLKDK